jgi:hypothetical protein
MNGLFYLQTKAHSNAKHKGFWDGTKLPDGVNLAERIALVHSELSEALEADRSGDQGLREPIPHEVMAEIKTGLSEGNPGTFKKYKEHVGFELADALIRILDIAAALGYNLEEYVNLKMAYNSSRPPMHGKKY